MTRTGRIARAASRTALVLGLAAVALVGASAAVLAAADPPRGRMVEIAEGRRLRVVCEGSGGPARPTVWFESGAWGAAADWAAVQAGLTRAAVRSCAYDRAGLGYSDPGPLPRDATAIAGDLDRAMTAMGETGPIVLVAHSAGGLYLRAFTAKRPDAVRGVVLVDAMTPESVGQRMAANFVDRFEGSERWLALAASLGLTKPLSLTPLADRIGLPAYARAEKRHALASGRHNRTAAAEVRAWPQAIEEGMATPPFPHEWPVAIVTQKRTNLPPAFSAFSEGRLAPARASVRGRVDEVQGAGHRTLLGQTHGGRVVDAVLFVMGLNVIPAAAERQAGTQAP
jgi:pimeloyl-ACP methyl ester carboxylesterase